MKLSLEVLESAEFDRLCEILGDTRASYWRYNRLKKELSVQRCREYDRVLEKFETYLSEYNFYLYEFTWGEMRGWLGSLKTSGSSVPAQYEKMIRSFVKWALKAGVIQRNPFINPDSSKRKEFRRLRRPKSVKALSKSDWEKLMSVRGHTEGKIIAILGATCGLPPTQAVQLRNEVLIDPDGIPWDRYVVRRPGRPNALFDMSGNLRCVLTEHINKKKSPVFLFPGRHDGSASRRMAYHWIKSLICATGLMIKPKSIINTGITLAKFGTDGESPKATVRVAKAMGRKPTRGLVEVALRNVGKVCEKKVQADLDGWVE